MKNELKDDDDDDEKRYYLLREKIFSHIRWWIERKSLTHTEHSYK